MATEANIPEDKPASKIIPEGGFSMIENKNSMESSTSNKSPAAYKCKSEHCQADEMENLTFTKSSEDERQHQTGFLSNDVEARGDKVEAINETVHIEESTRHTEKDGAKVSMQACAEELMIDQYKSPEVIAENTQKGMMGSQENENIRSKGEEDADLECIKQSTSTSETNMGLISEAPLPNLDLTTKSQGEEDERVEESCAKDETRDPAIHFEDEFKELSLDGVQKKKEDMPSSLRGKCKDPDSIRSSDKLENINNTEDASTINVEESGFDAALKIGDNVDDKLENPYSNQVQDGVSAQVATVARETLQEVASTICRDKIKDISEDSTINLEKNHEEKRDSQPKHGQEDGLREPTLIPEESEVVASRENAERRVEQDILPEEEFDKRGDKDEPTSTADSEETFISTEKMPPLAESIIKIKGEENMSPHKIANDLNSKDPLVGETGQPDTTDISNDSKISLEKQNEEKRDSQPKNGQEDQKGEQITPILDETEKEASRENAEKKIEQSTLPVEEFEERGEENEPTSTTDTGETSTSTEKIPPLAESITKIKGEENMIPQQIANDLNSTYPLVGETGQPDSTNMSEDSIINWEQHHEEKGDSQPKNGQEEQLGEQATLIPEGTEIEASRENTEKRVEQNTHHVEEFEERGEIDEPTSTPDNGETSISTEKIAPLAKSIIKIKGEENMIPQQIANELNSTYSLVGETGQPDSTDISEDSIINWEKHHEKKRDSQPKNGQEDQLGEHAILIPEEIDIEASRENAEKRVEQNTLPVEEYEEIGEIDEPISTPDSGETSISTEKIPSLAKSITKINGEENMIPQQIANFTDPLVGERGQPNNTNTSEDSIINFEKHHEEKRDSQPKNGQEDQLGEQAILILEETEIESSRENAEKSVEQNTLPMEEFEERGEIDKPTSTPNSGETSVSTEKIPSLDESITKIKGEENKTPQEIANDLNSTDPLVGETGQPDNSKVPNTEAQEEHQESSKFCPENNEQDKNVSETQTTKHLVVKHMDSEAMVTTETITKLTTDTKEPQKVLDSHSEDEMGIKGDEKILSEETTEGEGAINEQLFATESVTEDDEDPSRVPTVASSRDETIEQSSHEESLKDGEITLIEENESLKPKDEAEESKQAAEVFDLPYTRGGQDIYEQKIIEGSGEKTLNNFQENEKQIQNMRDDPHEEIKGENHVSDSHLEFIQNTGLEEGYPTAIHLYRNPNECSSAESKSSADPSSLDKSPAKNICGSDHQILTESENERQHQHEVEESNPTVHEEETSIEDKQLDQRLELITDQCATFEVIPASTEKEMITSQTNENTTPKRDEDADLECNQKGTNIFEKSCEGIDAALHDEDEFKEINLTGLQNEQAGQMQEVDWKDPESSRSSDKTEHENNDELKLMTSSTEDASTVTVAPSPYIHEVEEFTFEAPSNNEDNDKEKLDNPSSSLLADMENTQVAIEAGETMQDASNATCQDNNHDICESVRQEIDVTPVDNSPEVDDLACLKRDIQGEHEENIQTGFPDNSEESKINPETHDGEKRDLDHKNEQEHKVGEQARQILENIEIEAARENDEKKMEQNIYPAEDFDVKEPTSAPNTGETSISTEKSLSLVESISKISNEERISPQQIADNLNTNGPVVEETGQPYSGGIVSKTDVPEEHQELSEFCVECNKQHEYHPETQCTENLIIKQVDPIVTAETVSESIKDIEEIRKFPMSYSEEKKDIEKDEKIIPEESKEMEEAIDKQSHETAKESISEDQSPSRLLTTTSIRDEAIEPSTMEESLKDSESTLIEKNEKHRAENDAEEKIKAIQAPEPSEATGSKDVYDQQIMEGSVEETVDKFQYNEKENEDAITEIRGETCDTSLPYEVNQNNGLEEGHSMADQLEGNPNKCSLSEFESSVELSSIEESQTEKNLESEQFQANKAEAINDIGIKEPDHDIEHDSAKSSTFASVQKSNIKVHGKEFANDNSNLDQHDQHASFEVIPECVEKEIITSQTKREEDADLECSDQVTSTYEITLDKTSKASLHNLELAIMSKCEEDKTVIESLTEDEGLETTKQVEHESKDLSLTRILNREAKAFVREGRQRDLESIGSSNNIEYENIREEDASTTNIVQLPCVCNVEESIDEVASKNADNGENNWENPSCNPVTDGASLQVAIEAVEALQEASHIACKDKNKDTCESVWPEEDVPPVDKMARLEDSAYLETDAKGANEEDINQAELTETIEDSRINPETHDVEKKESLQKNDQEYELGEQAVLIPEKAEEEAPIEKAEKRIEQDPNSVEKFEEQEKDEPTYSPDSGETLIITEKSLQLAESTNKINSEERIFPQNIASGLNTKDPLVEDLGKFDIDETGKKTQEKFEYSSNTYTENDKQDEQHSEAPSTENLDEKHMYSEEMVATNTVIKSTKETEEINRVLKSLSQEKTDIKGDEKITPEEPKEMEETTGVSENEALSRLPITASVGEEKTEQNFQEESPKDDAAMIDKNESCIPEIDAEKNKKAVQEFGLPKTRGRQDIDEKQVIEESIEETMKNFQDNEMKTQSLREDTGEIEGKSSVSNVSSEPNQHGKTDETTIYESNKTVENHDILDISSKKDEETLFGQYGNPTTKEASTENQDESVYSMKVDEDKAQLASQYFEKVTCTEGEETSVQLENFSQKERMEKEPKDKDSGKENNASHQEVNEPSGTEFFALKPDEGEIKRTAGTLSSATVGTDTRKEYMEEVECDQTEIKEEDDFLAKDQSEEILIHSNNIQTKGKDNNLQDQDSQSLQEVPALNLEPGCNDEDLLNSSLDQDGNINAIKITHEVEVSTSKLTEQNESTKSTEGEKPQALDSQAEQNMEITDLSALNSSDASSTNIDDSSSTPKVYEKETEASFIKKDDSATDDPKIVSVIVEIEETGPKNSKTGHKEYDRGSILVSENEVETAITTDKTTSDSIDVVGREEISNSEKEEILEELNEGNLKMDSWVMETDKTTTVQQERAQSISTISLSQDYPAPLIEENATMGNAKIHPKEAKSTREEITDEAAETCHVYSVENTLPEKEHEVVKPGGTSDLGSVNIMKECSNVGDSPRPKNEVNEEKVLVGASKCKADSTHEDSEAVQGQGNEDTTLEGSLTNVAIENEKTALENEPTDEVPPQKTVEAADRNQKVELAFESTAEDQRDENICQAKGKGNCEDNVYEIRNNVPDKRFQGGIQREADMQFEIVHHMSVPRDTEATMLGVCTENVPATIEMANGSKNILQHSQEPTSNLKEYDISPTCYKTINNATATNSGFIEQGGGMDLVEERESRISENLANANEDFSFTTIEASEEGLHTECKKENKAKVSNKDDTHTFESRPCLPAERNDVITIDKVAKTEMSSSEDSRDKKSQERAERGCENQHEEKSEATEDGEYGSTKDNPPDDEDGKNVTKAATELTHENQGTEPKITSNTTVVMNQGEKDQEVEANSSEKEHIDTAEVSESTQEIQKLKESSLGEGDIKAIGKADAEYKEANEDVEQGIHKPDGETKAEVQLEKVKSTNMIVESTVEGENVSSSTREIQKLEEEVDIKATVKADAETRETNEGIEQSLHKPDEVIKLEVQLEEAKSTNITVENTRVEEENVSSSVMQETKHLDEEAMELAVKAEKAETPQHEEDKAECDEDERVNENEKIEPLPYGAAIMVETPKDGEVKAKHKKSHNILSGVGSKVKHSISKVKKAITGKSSHPKTLSPK